MELTAYFQQAFDYDSWANRRVLDAAKALPEEQLFRQQGHSWDSIHGVLLHIMNAQWIWLRRWQGESPKAFFKPAEFPTLASVELKWAQVEAEMRAFLASQTSSSLEQEIAYANTSGKSFRLPLWQMMAHVINHGTHHRGELAAMFATLNAPHPEDEWSQYFLTTNGQQK
jgi:uncharacterized damage-inducible protein DinB